MSDDRASEFHPIRSFENETCFCAMLGNKNADNLVAVMTEFAQAMPVKPVASVCEANTKGKPKTVTMFSFLARTLNLG